MQLRNSYTEPLFKELLNSTRAIWGGEKFHSLLSFENRCFISYDLGSPLHNLGILWYAFSDIIFVLHIQHHANHAQITVTCSSSIWPKYSSMNVL